MVEQKTCVQYLCVGKRLTAAREGGKHNSGSGRGCVDDRGGQVDGRGVLCDVKAEVLKKQCPVSGSSLVPASSPANNCSVRRLALMRVALCAGRRRRRRRLADATAYSERWLIDLACIL